MAEVATRLPLSLDDVIALARDRGGSAAVAISAQEIVHKRPEGDEEAYLLVAEFTFRIDRDSYQVFQVYEMGTLAEPAEVGAIRRRIANDRLRRDYRRLHEGNIDIEPRYFAEV